MESQWSIELDNSEWDFLTRRYGFDISPLIPGADRSKMKLTIHDLHPTIGTGFMDEVFEQLLYPMNGDLTLHYPDNDQIKKIFRVAVALNLPSLLFEAASDLTDFDDYAIYYLLGDRVFGEWRENIIFLKLNKPTFSVDEYKRVMEHVTRCIHSRKITLVCMNQGMLGIISNVLYGGRGGKFKGSIEAFAFNLGAESIGDNISLLSQIIIEECTTVKTPGELYSTLGRYYNLAVVYNALLNSSTDEEAIRYLKINRLDFTRNFNISGSPGKIEESVLKGLSPYYMNIDALTDFLHRYIQSVDLGMFRSWFRRYTSNDQDLTERGQLYENHLF